MTNQGCSFLFYKILLEDLCRQILNKYKEEN